MWKPDDNAYYYDMKMIDDVAGRWCYVINVMTYLKFYLRYFIENKQFNFIQF